MKKLLFTLLSLFCLLSSVSAQEEVLWEGTAANVLEARYSLADNFKNANLQVGDVLRVYLTNMTEEQNVYLKLDGGSVNSPTLLAADTKYFDHTLTADNIAKIENTGEANTSYTNGGLYIKFAKTTGQVYKVTVRRNGTAKNRFGLYLGDPVQDNMYFTSGNNLLTWQAAEIAVNDTIVMQFSGATSGDKMWLQNSSWGGDYGFADVLSVGEDGSGEWRAVLPQAAVTDFASTGCIFHRSSTEYSIGNVYLHKYVKPEGVVTPPATETILWTGALTSGSADLRYGTYRVAVNAANISANDTIKVYVSGADAGDQVNLKECKEWTGIYKSLTSGQNIVEYPMTAIYAAKINNEDTNSGSFVVQRNDGDDYTLRYITVAKYVEKAYPTVETLVEGDTYIQWDGSVCTIPASKLEHLAVGDKLHVYINHWYTSASTKDNMIEDEAKTTARLAIQRNSGKNHDYITDNSVYMVNSLENNEFVLEFTQDIYDKMFADDGIGYMYDLMVSGYWYGFNKVTLEHVTPIVENRTTAKNSYGTICLPYDATSDGVILLQMNGRTDNGIQFDYVGGTETSATNASLEAGVPYVYRATADSQTFTCDMTSTKVDTPTESNKFVGVYVATTIEAGKYFLYADDNMFHPAAEAGEIDAYKCYINTTDISSLTEATSAVARAAVFGVHTDTTTGINQINTTVNFGKNGKFIENGRLIIVKDNRKFNVLGQPVK